MAEHYCNSYYTHTANSHAPFQSLQEDIEVDVAIIGGGFTGVATALELAEKDVSVAVLESNRIGWGATSRNGGQITGSLSGDKAMEREFARTLGQEEAKRFVWNLRWRGHDIIRKRVAKYNIDCDLKFGHLHAAWQSSHLQELEDMYALACARGMEDQVEMVHRDDISTVIGTSLYAGGLINRRNMHVHSLNLCLGEAEAARSRGAQIFERSKVINISNDLKPALTTEHGRVRAGKVLLAGNAYHRLAQHRMAGLLLPASLGVVATESLPQDVAKALNPQDLGVYDTRFVLDYYRLTADRRLLFGGGTNYSGRESKNIAAQIRPSIETTFPQLQGIGIDFAWQGQAGITLNRIPQLGQLSDTIYYAQGYSGHGIATTHIVAEIMSEALCGPSRDFQTFANARQWRLPVGRYLSNQLLALGMWYYQKSETWR